MRHLNVSIGTELYASIVVFDVLLMDKKPDPIHYVSGAGLSDQIGETVTGNIMKHSSIIAQLFQLRKHSSF